jgi:hypothetical protein
LFPRSSVIPVGLPPPAEIVQLRTSEPESGRDGPGIRHPPRAHRASGVRGLFCWTLLQCDPQESAWRR